MTLPYRILLAQGCIRFGGGLILLSGIYIAGWSAILVAILWLTLSGVLSRRLILPALFPATTCSCCKTHLKLRARWRYGHTYIDHKQRHILNFHTNHGIELGSFKCPVCSATIQVQKGSRQKYKQGEIVVGSEPSASDTKHLAKTGLLVGTLRGENCSTLKKWARLILRKPQNQLVIASPAITNTHGYIVGGSNMGKSTLMLNLAKQKFESGEGGLFLDPAGDLSTDLLGLVPESRIQDVIYVKPSDDSLRCAFNIFDAESPIERKVLGDHVIDIFRRLYPKSWGDRLEDIMRMAILATVDSGGSFQDLFELIADSGARAKTMSKLRKFAVEKPERDRHTIQKIIRYFEDEFSCATPAVRASLVTKLRGIVSHPFVGPMLSARECDVQADDVIQNRKIVIVNLATGSPSDYTLDIIGIFMINKFVAGMYRQQNVPPEYRIPFTIFADEFQNFMHKANGIDKIISESRKYKLTLIVANQFLTQLNPMVRDAIFGNIRFITCFGVSADDARILAAQLPHSQKQDFLALRRGQCIVKLGDNAYPTMTFPPPNSNDSVSKKIIVANRNRFRRNVGVVPTPTPNRPIVETSCSSQKAFSTPTLVVKEPVVRFVN